MFSNSSKIFTVLSLPVVSVLVGCSAANFAVTPTGNTAKGLSCTGQTVAAITRLTKIIFVVDTSGSNVVPTMQQGTVQCDPTQNACTPPTDPTKSFRGGAIQNFFTKYQAKTNFQWGFLTFAGTQAKSLIGAGAAPYITGSIPSFQTAIQSFLATTDFNATPYKAALQLTQQAIQSDPDLNTSLNPQYFVILLTDGFPTDYTTNGVFNSSALHSDLSSLLAVAPGRVKLSAVNYGQVDDPNAVALLQSMAQLGAGQFARAADTSTAIQIDDLIPGTQATCTPQ